MAAATTNPDHRSSMFDDHGSVAASLEDFEEQERRSPLFDIPSQHSGFKSENDGSEIDDHSSAGAPWSPPGFRNHRPDSGGSAAAWFRQDPYGRFALRPQPMSSPRGSRQTSPEYEDARGEQGEDLTIAANIPLPRAGTISPVKGQSPEPEIKSEPNDTFSTPEPESPATNNNYIRLAIRAEVLQREPFMPLLNLLSSTLHNLTSTKLNTLLSFVTIVLSLTTLRLLSLPPTPQPVPDLVKLSSLAKSFEPLIFYSEHGHAQTLHLQETSIAVWDLGESVRLANMTSAPLIVSSLDTLSESLKSLSLELTRFFAAVDADVDGILIVMDWARRELLTLSHSQHNPSYPTLAYDRLYALANRFPPHLLQSPKTHQPTALGHLVTNIFGTPTPTRTHATLSRTFHELLSVLEESITSELTHSAALFSLFEAIDRQFLNLQRTVVRETDTQERLESDLLSGLWVRVVGVNGAALKKFERNKELLRRRLQTLKVGLEAVRRKLVSPLISRNDSVSLLPGLGGGSSRDSQGQGDAGGGQGVIEGQIKGLESTHDYLRQVREKQKAKLMEMVYGSGSRRDTRMLTGVGVDGEGVPVLD
ncbi:uncharacterized protein AB675_10772 [Cyphellophora attinorum]|uniref:Uncharacterized protein n=1 Tax=Cyphellophora attinorum TaxID=1664694 RepID=A0A0N0NMX0_9EURO|nr:uncharacterized protein AB675_10772 [Phialophora attinorum]KPI40838.1 hypothetical protein AB675_10772 [Phialophora attinorum]